MKKAILSTNNWKIENPTATGIKRNKSVIVIKSYLNIGRKVTSSVLLKV